MLEQISFNLGILQPVYWKGVLCHQTALDMWNYQEIIWERKPKIILEVGRADGGTWNFMKDLNLVETVLSIDINEPIPNIKNAMIFIDSDVYNKENILKDLETYSPMANILIVCHTNREDWGAIHAVKEWRQAHKEVKEFFPKRPTAHTWLTLT